MKNKNAVLIFFSISIMIFLNVNTINISSLPSLSTNFNDNNYSMEQLKAKIEEKQRLLQMIYSKQNSGNAVSVNQQFNGNKNANNKYAQTASKNKFPENHENDSNSREFNSLNNQIDVENKDGANHNNDYLSDIKPLLKSIVDMQYYSYQILSKMKSSIEDIKKDVEEIKESNLRKLEIEEDKNENTNKLRQIKDKKNKIKLNKTEQLIEP